MHRLKKSAATLRAISEGKRKARLAILKSCGKDILFAISDISRNLLEGNLPLTDEQIENLSLYKRALRSVAYAKPDYIRRRLIREDSNFFRCVLPIVLSKL